eukprot:scaffold1900_cov123-Cylindrotheca_fusiformis.AAC.13
MKSSSSSPEEGVASLALPDPDEDFPDLAADPPNETADPTDFVKPKKGKGDFDDDGDDDGDGEADPLYILGTLIVRVVAARDLEPVQKGGGFPMLKMSKGAANPYASVKFGTTTQRTSEVFDTLDPIWPRNETMFMDVALPISKLTHPEVRIPQSGSSASMPEEDDDAVKKAAVQYEKPNSTMTVALFHNPDFGSGSKSVYPNKGGSAGKLSGDSDDMFLGMASVDLTRLLTGTDNSFDRWLTLTGTATSRGSVRVVCEYEPSDPPPRRNDFCRFTSFCRPKDLYPLVPGRQYRVSEVDGDIILITYKSQEGWVCTFEAHRYMLMCQDYAGPVATAQDELERMAERLSYSPLVHQVGATVERVAVEGLLSVGNDIVHNGWGLFNRWMEGGVDTAINDVVNVVNWDGRYNPDNGERLDLREATSSDSVSTNDDELNEKLDGEEERSDALAQALQGMPSCPITGEPMIDPVVAADGTFNLKMQRKKSTVSALTENLPPFLSAGHTYERSAIARWFKTSNKSPLTGAVLSHKELVSNYMLLSSIQEAVSRANMSPINVAETPEDEPAEQQDETLTEDDGLQLSETNYAKSHGTPLIPGTSRAVSGANLSPINVCQPPEDEPDEQQDETPTVQLQRTMT